MKTKKTTKGKDINNKETNRIIREVNRMILDNMEKPNPDRKSDNELMNEFRNKFDSEQKIRRKYEKQTDEHLILKDFDILLILHSALIKYPNANPFIKRSEIFKNAKISDKLDGNTRIEFLEELELIQNIFSKKVFYGFKIKFDSKIRLHKKFLTTNKGLLLLNSVNINDDSRDRTHFLTGRGTLIHKNNLEKETININGYVYLKEIIKDREKLDEVLNDLKKGKMKIEYLY